MKFNPWEIPTDKFAERIEEGATISWKGNDWQVLLIRTTGADRKILAVRQLNCAGIAPLWRVGRLAVSSPVYSCCVWNAKNAGASPEELVRDALEEGRLALWYHTDSDLNLRSQGETATRKFSLNANNQGSMRKMPVDLNPHLFFWPSPKEDFTERNSLKWWEILRKELATPCSDASFALDLGDMSSQQQHDLLWKWKNGSYETAREVLSCALLSQYELWDKESWWMWNINFPLGDEKRYGTTGSIMRAREANPFHALQQAAELIDNYFSPHADEHLMRTSFCARNWYKSHPIKFGVDHESPTMHERMEATLLWREWQEKMRG